MDFVYGKYIHMQFPSLLIASSKLSGIVIYLREENETFTPKKFVAKVSLFFQMVLSIGTKLHIDT